MVTGHIPHGASPADKGIGCGCAVWFMIAFIILLTGLVIFGYYGLRDLDAFLTA